MPLDLLNSWKYSFVSPWILQSYSTLLLGPPNLVCGGVWQSPKSWEATMAIWSLHVPRSDAQSHPCLRHIVRLVLWIVCNFWKELNSLFRPRILDFCPAVHLLRIFWEFSSFSTTDTSNNLVYMTPVAELLVLQPRPTRAFACSELHSKLTDIHLPIMIFTSAASKSPWGLPGILLIS